MQPTDAVLVFITGIIAGTFGGLLGIGGGLIMLPSLTFIFGYPLKLAIGTSITAVVFTAVSGALGHLRLGNVDFSTAKIVSVSGAAGAILGSGIFLLLAEKIFILEILMGFAFLYTALRMILEGLKREEKTEGRKIQISGSKISKAFLGFSVGILAGLLGIGGGFVLVPSFVYLFGSTVKIAVGTSLASFLGIALVSSAFKLYQGVVDIPAALFLGFGTVLGAQLGARLIIKIPSWAIKTIFGFVFLCVSLRFLWSGFLRLSITI
ncbi:MAG: sulfite exporter TauE/SafE family protein [Candidatus Methanoglobus sp.]